MLSRYQKEKQFKSDCKFVFSSEEGKRVLSHILRECRVLQPTFALDPHQTAFNEGMRNVALMIMTALDETPERFPELSQEIIENGR